MGMTGSGSMPQSGATLVILPSACWSSAKDVNYLRANPLMSSRWAAPRAKIWKSPVYPQRSRCGQSVGMSREFDLQLATAMRWSSFKRWSLEENVPMW